MNYDHEMAKRNHCALDGKFQPLLNIVLSTVCTREQHFVMCKPTLGNKIQFANTLNTR